ncbi:DUF1540 domain-containing protein [Dethiobacter alkaliphilus]|uniref:DUF1540 domain-containing protein n=1 Tax=Dethiobacter alkaliphilus TaxID=427926 RepID=UPI0022266EFA|nr:DUF1540 domain-containing protein [Dethiobacter alkaliphilus]MCW3488661.1 DUF1540 domain-containing protein [Dethiobacter alkaliphilus]
MTRVVCRAVYCAHNVGGDFCNAAGITINENKYGEEETDCSTFLPRDFSASLSSMDNVNYAGMVARAFSRLPLAHPDVECEVGFCEYHAGDKGCAAVEIQVLAANALTSAETFCGTYRPKSIGNYKR